MTFRTAATRTAAPLLALAAGLALGIAAAAADPIPQTVLDQNTASCQQACVGAGKAPDKCTAYCSCSTNAIEEKFTAAEYDAVNRAVNAKQPIPQGSADKFNAIIKSCGAPLK